MNQPKNLVQKAGFTLIELSIVLVIIGLIVGGVLVGQDLIKAAEIRATIAQVEKYNTAVNTFKGKYGALPGDITATATGQATQFGFFTETGASAGQSGHGDGNGLIEGGAADSTAPRGETLTFWRHLSDASLTDGSYGVVGTSALQQNTGGPAANVTNVQQSLPVAKLGPAGFFVVYSSSGFNYYQIFPVRVITTTPDYTGGITGLTGMQAYNIDLKLDDGQPNTGTVRAKGIATVAVPGTQPNANPSVNTAAQADTCTVGTGAATDNYNRVVLANGTTAEGGNDPACSVQFVFN